MSISHQYVMKHFQELARRPLQNVAVCPSESDMNVWHVNFFFPKEHQYFPELILHFKMTFPSDYPNSSPDVKLFTSFLHSHVHGYAVCFSLLPDFRGYFQATGTPKSAYWNPARTARSFLEDLYTFLLVDDDQHVVITPDHTENALAAAKKFTCSCGHSFESPNPARPNRNVSSTNASSNLPGEHALEVLNRQECDESDAAKLPSCNLSSETMEDLRCSITSSLFLDEGVVMGFGICVEHLPGGKLAIETDLSPLSSQAFFEHQIRTTSDGNTITHFVPYVINEQHFMPAAQQILARTVASITDRKNMNPVNGLLLVMGEIWKSKAVMLMGGKEHASEKALKGFCAIHHLLLSCSRYMPLVKVRLFHQALLDAEARMHLHT